MGLGLFGQAQDLHNSDYRFNPLYFNPALTGGFEGTIRAGSVHRDQFRTFIGQAYQSTSLWVDSPISYVINENSWLGVGANFYRDIAGDLGLGHNGVLGSAALHISLDKKYRKVLAFGGQIGYLQKKINQSTNARFQDQILTNSTSQDFDRLDQFQSNTLDFSLGMNWTQTLNKYQKYSLGLSLHHFNGIFESIAEAPLLENRINVYGNWTSRINKRFTLESLINASVFKEYSIVQVQMHTLYQLKKKGDKFLTSGLGLRFGDAIQLMGGMIIKNWHISLAYDLTVSSAWSYTKTAGAFEIGVRRTFILNKKPEIEPSIICPRT